MSVVEGLSKSLSPQSVAGFRTGTDDVFQSSKPMIRWQVVAYESVFHENKLFTDFDSKHPVKQQTSSQLWRSFQGESLLPKQTDKQKIQSAPLIPVPNKPYGFCGR